MRHDVVGLGIGDIERVPPLRVRVAFRLRNRDVVVSDLLEVDCSLLHGRVARERVRPVLADPIERSGNVLDHGKLR